MGQASMEQKQAQDTVFEAVVGGEFTYAELVLMLAGEVRYMSKESLEKMLLRAERELNDFTV